MAAPEDEPGPEPPLVAYRYGVRVMPVDAVRQLVRIAGVMFFVGGLSIFQVAIVGGSKITYFTPYIVLGVAAVLVGAGLFLLGRLLPDESVEVIYSRLFAPLLFFSSAFITAVMYTAGIQLANIGAGIYLVPAILSFYGLTRRLAMAFLAFSIVNYGLVLVLQPGLPAPVAQWLFMSTLLTVAGILIGGFVEHTEHLAASEQRARIALAEVNATLETRVHAQVDELAHYEQLRRFLAPQVADAVMSSGTEALLEPHRREIAVFFSDLRGFTNFAGRVEPEEVLDVLNAYYAAVGEVVHDFEATVGHFAGDGVMAYFNDPVPCDDPAGTAVCMALRLRARLDRLAEEWAGRGYRLGYGMGVALGHATLGIIGFEGRSDYTPLGTVVNLASRLCAEATDGQILVDHRVGAALTSSHEVSAVEDLVLKGLPPDVRAFAVLGEIAS